MNIQPIRRRIVDPNRLLLMGENLTGKDTMIDLWAAKYGWPKKSAGTTVRERETSKSGAFRLEYEERAQNDAGIDISLEQTMINFMDEQERCVIEWRLGPFMYERCTAIKLRCRPEKRFERGALREGKPFELVAAEETARNAKYRGRFKGLYNIDIEDEMPFPHCFQGFVDTSDIGKNEMLPALEREYKRIFGFLPEPLTALNASA